MSWFLGIDTSNYTTSVAAYNPSIDKMISLKERLPVKCGELGLRQSDAVFVHTKQLGGLIEAIAGQVGSLVALGVSTRPRNKEDSYMPCFLTGKLVAKSIASLNRIPCIEFSHQEGHIGAVIYDVKQYKLMDNPFLAFHLSGGTTDSIFVNKGKKNFFDIEEVSSSMDLYAGQLIDRVGKMLGLSFPSGMDMEKLAMESAEEFDITPFLRNGNPSISGLENQCKKMIEKKCTSEQVAKFTFDWLAKMLEEMTVFAQKKYSNIPIIYAGGVMSNSIIRKKLEKQNERYFSSPDYSTDNAAGIAFLTAKAIERNKNVNS